jgi:hypothetical protein
VRNQRWQGQASLARFQPRDIGETIPQDVATSVERTRAFVPMRDDSIYKVAGGLPTQLRSTVAGRSPGLKLSCRGHLNDNLKGKIRMRILENINA